MSSLDQGGALPVLRADDATGVAGVAGVSGSLGSFGIVMRYGWDGQIRLQMMDRR